MGCRGALAIRQWEAAALRLMAQTLTCACRNQPAQVHQQNPRRTWECANREKGEQELRLSRWWEVGEEAKETLAWREGGSVGHQKQRASGCLVQF